MPRPQGHHSQRRSSSRRLALLRASLKTPRAAAPSPALRFRCPPRLLGLGPHMSGLHAVQGAAERRLVLPPAAPRSRAAPRLAAVRPWPALVRTPRRAALRSSPGRGAGARLAPCLPPDAGMASERGLACRPRRSAPPHAHIALAVSVAVRSSWLSFRIEVQMQGNQWYAAQRAAVRSSYS